MKNCSCLYLLIFIVFFSCKKEKPAEYTGKIRLVFTHGIDSENLQTNVMVYQNAAENDYEVDELKYFISDLILYKSGTQTLVDDNKAIHYIDIAYPYTLSWEVNDDIPEGNYDSLSFIFGLNEVRNQSSIFTNPPEVNMFWPSVLGGGYHYIMMNGKWRKPDNSITNFNFHFGIGQIYSGTTTNTDSITGFVQNYFRVSLVNSSFKVIKDSINEIGIHMNINSWFATPHIYDHNFWGGAIMQNQQAMNMAKENGYDVFSIIKTK